MFFDSSNSPHKLIIPLYFFTLIFFLFNFMNCYMYLIKNEQSSESLNNIIKKTLTWKW